MQYRVSKNTILIIYRVAWVQFTIFRICLVWTYCKTRSLNLESIDGEVRNKNGNREPGSEMPSPTSPQIQFGDSLLPSSIKVDDVGNRTHGYQSGWLFSINGYYE